MSKVLSSAQASISITYQVIENRRNWVLNTTLNNSQQLSTTEDIFMGMHGQQRTAEFCALLKHWRQFRSLSQLDLALRADVSQRHVSWLETGRSQPSREMVLKLSETMDIPLRERNQLLNAAGFTGMFTENKLEEPVMQPVMQVISRMLDNHEPYPAIVLDRLWNLRMKNKAADILFEVTGDPDELWDAVGDNGEHNIALLSIHLRSLWSSIKGLCLN